MKARNLLFLIVIVVAGAAAALAQSEPNLEIGFKPYGSYHGNEIDTLGLMNGNLSLHIPYPYHYPQRGGRLDDQFLSVMNSKTWTVQAYIPPGNTSPPSLYWTVNDAWNAGTVAFVDTLLPRLGRTYEHDTDSQGNSTYSAYGYSLTTWDGAQHSLMDVSNGATQAFEATDGSGWRINLTTTDANGTPQGGFILDGSGNQYQFTGFSLGRCTTTVNDPTPPGNGDAVPTQPLTHDSTTICPQVSQPVNVVDANGNVYNLSSQTDTLGRTPFGAGSTDTSGCVSSLPVSSAYLTTYLAPNGVTNSIKTCLADVALQTSFGVAGIADYPNNPAQWAGAPGSASVPVTIILPDGAKWTFSYDSYGNVTCIGLPLGGSITYQWATVALPTETQRPPVSRVVTARTITDNNGHSDTWTYQWMVQQSSPNSPNGTYTNKVTDPLGNDTLHVFTNFSGVGFYETATLSYQGSSTSGQLLKRVDTGYFVAQVGGNTLQGDAFTVLPTSIQTTVYPSGKVSLIQKTYDRALTDPASGATSYGKVLTEKVYDWGQGAPGALLRETDTSYQWQLDGRYLTAHLLGLPSAVVVKDGAGNRVAETDYAYDESPYLTAANISTQHGAAPNAVRGNPTTVSHWLNTSNSLISSHTNWYDTGEVYQQIDPLGNTTTHNYDAAYAGAYATKTTNPLNQSVSATYDFNTGLLTSFTSANATTQAIGNTPGDAAHTSAYAYDFMSRMTSATLPADSSGNHPQTTFNYPDATTMERRKKITASLTDDAFTYADGLGRLVRAQHVTPNGNVKVDTTYDGLSRAATVTNPYISTSELTYGITQSQYDALGRITQTTRQDGGLSTVSYSDNCTTTRDEAGSQRRACNDTLGRLTSVFEDPAGLNYETDYQYDALGNLLRVDQKGSAPTDSSKWRTRLFTYDSLSRLLTANNPESGVISYFYDANGNLLQRVSPAPNQTGTATHTISYCYDSLNRVTGKAYSWQNCQNGRLPSGTAVVSYTYDQGTNSLGHLSSLTDQAGSASYSYDVLGRMSSEQRTIASVTKTMSYTYNLDGSVATATYPSGATITYTPDSAGRVLSAVDTGSNINYVTGATYGPQNALTASVYGQSSSFSGITNTFVYNNRLQPCRTMASSGGAVSPNCDASWGNLLDRRYDFHLGNGDNGNVYGITHYGDQTRNQTFTYDALNRLISAQNAGTDCTRILPDGHTEYWGNSYGYDAWGNLLGKTPTKCSAENLSLTAVANNQLQGGYTYDAAGNMLHDATANLNYAYDQENRIAGAAGFIYTYDADGNRVEKANGATGTLYWYMSLGIVAESDLLGNLHSEYVFFDGERVARKDFPGNAVSYYFSDHLKTASVITDATGNIKSESDYYPWGGELQFTNNDSNHYKFTGKERDAETGLDYFGARYYSNGLGRFITPDWSAVPVPVPYADLTNPQTLNQYAFVHNNPMTILDPDGHDGEAAAFWDFLTGGVEVSGPAWTVGSIALPGVLGGGLAYSAINSTAQNNNIVANATMQEISASNRLVLAKQSALSQDAQAGALIKAGTDANKAAAAAIDEAIKGIAAGKYKDATDVQTHVDKLKEGMQEVAKKVQAVKDAVGQKARDAAKKELDNATKDVKGHEKDLRQKPKVKEQKSGD